MLWISEPEVAEMVDLEDAIVAEEAMLVREAAGEARNMTKALGQYGERNAMHALGSMAPATGYVGFKTWNHTRHGAGTIFSLFDAERGTVLAVIEAAVLSQLRTAAISGVATRRMAREDADTMALIGSGKQALLQVAAVAAVRPLKRLTVYSPTESRRRDFVARASEAFSFAVEEAPTIADATRDAGIVTVVTRAREPFFSGRDLAPGAHVNAVGAILRGFAEFHQDVFDRAEMVVVDNVANVRAISAEFIEHYESGPGDWAQVRPLCEIVAAGHPRPDGIDISLFKALGMGIADLALATMIYQRARERGLGRDIPSMGKSKARWRSARPTNA
ncbi:MAG TPA: ornithine cyclodeaminase family protein [Sphingomonadaceae bacterium]|nr:ornithine cyclodeaminase family protein [Sphingomonadaceae bacterium]